MLLQTEHSTYGDATYHSRLGDGPKAVYEDVAGHIYRRTCGNAEEREKIAWTKRRAQEKCHMICFTFTTANM